MIRQEYYQKNKYRWKIYALKQKVNKRLWFLKNRERLKEYSKQYRQKNKETLKKYFLDYYYAHHNKFKEKNRVRAEEIRRKDNIPLRKDMVGEKHYSWRGGLPHCVDCGKQLSNRNAKRCFPCSHRILSGERNPMWTGGHTHWRKSLYATSQYKQWRKAIFERDNYTCQICFKRGNGGLEAHHKKRMIVIIKEFIPILKNFKGYEIRNRLLNYQPLWDIDNGITLCLDCHGKEKQKDKEIIKQCLTH